MTICSAAVDPGDFAKLGHQFVGSSHGTGEGAANAEVVFAGSLLSKTRVKGDNFDNLDGGNVEFVRDPVDGLGADKAEVMLDLVKKRENCRAALIGGIMVDALISRLLQFGRDLEGREVDRAGGYRRVDILFQDRWFRAAIL